MKYPKLRELKEAIKALIKGPYTTKFPYKPSLPHPNFRGKPEYYEEDCVGCGACAQVCPANAIDISEDMRSRARKLTLRLEDCIFCGNCQANCITEKGIKLTNEYDLATYDRKAAIVNVEKDILVCQDCNCVIGAKDHLRLLVKKLGILAYSNPVLILSGQRELELAKPIEQREIEQPEGRSDLFRILCPKCRRQVMLEDEHGK